MNPAHRPFSPGEARTSRGVVRLLVCLLAVVGGCGSALAHKLSDSFLDLRIDGVEVTAQWEIALSDLELAVGLDADHDGQITWGEVRRQHAAIAAYALGRLSLVADDANIALTVTRQEVSERSGGLHAVLNLTGRLAAVPRVLSVSYRLLFDLNPTHRGFLVLRTAGREETTVLGPDAPTATFDLAAPAKPAAFRRFVLQGITHIWLGFDHILFLLALLLPAVLQRRDRAWTGVAAFRPAATETAKVVTAFTAAHSLTLALATLRVAVLPSRWVETAIAVSVGVAALNNLRPFLPGRVWMVAFGFGLIHGFGFAGALGEIGLEPATLLTGLVGFNLGVELGQLAIVAAFLPLAYALRTSWGYQRIALRWGSAAILLLASTWGVERLMNWRLLPF